MLVMKLGGDTDDKLTFGTVHTFMRTSRTGSCSVHSNDARYVITSIIKAAVSQSKIGLTAAL
jgi:hypothetical protein